MAAIVLIGALVGVAGTVELVGSGDASDRDVSDGGGLSRDGSERPIATDTVPPTIGTVPDVPCPEGSVPADIQPTDGPGPDDTGSVGGWLVPTWVPEGLDVWGVEWSEGPSDEVSPLDWRSYQLFGDPDAGRALYVLMGEGLYPHDMNGERRITVRGHRGWAGWWADAATLEDMANAIEWREGETTIYARFKGMTTDEAISAVEAMAWRTDDPRDGFAPPADGSFPLRGEALDEQVRSARTASFVYSQGAPPRGYDDPRLALDIRTSTAAGMTVGYLDEWFHGGCHRPAGSHGSRRTFDDIGQELEVNWPDGSQVTIYVSSGAADQETLERIADSVVSSTETDMTSLHDRNEANRAALPVVASAETSIGTLQLFGDDGWSGYRALCLRRPNGAGLDCGEDHHTYTAATSTTSWVIDGAWFVGVVAPFEPRVLAPRGSSLPGETATDGDLHFLLVQPPPTVDAVQVPDSADLDPDAPPDTRAPIPRPQR